MSTTAHRLTTWGAAALAVVLTVGTAGAQILGGPGPSVMSRGGNAPGGRGSEPADFVLYGGLLAGYESGIYIPVVNSNGQVEPDAYYNVSLDVGAYGSHVWRRSSIGLDYRADYRHYTGGRTYMNGTDQILGLEYRTRLSRRWEIAAREAAGTTSRPFGGFASPAYVSSDYFSVPVTDVYNNRTYFSQTTAYAGYRSTARTMYTLGGGYFTIQRQSNALVDATGYNAIASVEHRVNRDVGIGASYFYMKYKYPQIFGDTNMHGVSGSITRQLSRSSQASLTAGVYRLEILGTEAYTLQPEIAAILGRGTGTRVLYRVNYLSHLAASITYRRRQMSYNAGYTRGATPGNGVYLTSQNDSVSVGASYAGIRRASFGASAYYTRMTSLLQAAEPFQYYGAGVGMSYNIGHGLNWMLQADWRNMSAGQAIVRRNGYVISSGFTFSSSPIPLSLW